MHFIGICIGGIADGCERRSHAPRARFEASARTPIFFHGMKLGDEVSVETDDYHFVELRTGYPESSHRFGLWFLDKSVPIQEPYAALAELARDARRFRALR